MKCLPVKLQVQKMVLVEPSASSSSVGTAGEPAGEADRKEHPGSHSEPALNPVACDPMSAVALLPLRRDAA